MKITLVTSLCTVAVALTALGQSPTPPPDATSNAPVAAPTAPPAVNVTIAPAVAPAAAAPVATATAAPSAAASAAPDNDEDFDKVIERKINRHFRIDLDGNHSSHHSGDDVPWIAVPIVFIVFITIFGLPVAVVGIILFFANSRNRAMHKTVRMLVEKGQPVPEALLNPPPVVRQRSDLRRGVILVVVGAGLMVFFGAVNDWEGGAWSLGFIPFIIGLGYLLVWKLDIRRGEETSSKV
jgi:hypothetical protein